jgi:GNAT superfamily N-acetyltransferase
MDRDLSIRSFKPNAGEYAAVAAVAAYFSDEELVDFEYAEADGLRAFDESFARTEYMLRRLVAVVGNTIVGYTQFFHIPWLREPGRFWAAIRVAPASQRQGIGDQLYRHMVEELRRLGAITVQGEVFESQLTLIAHLERLGCHELFRSWEFSLDTRDFDLARFHHAAERPAKRGIAITTLAQERERGADWLPKLYELHSAITRDIPLPGHPHPAPGLDWFERYACDLPLSMPDAYFIATDGERYVGESCLHRIAATPSELNQQTTGVLSEYRGYGIAMALKLRTIAYAQQHGYTRIWTGVESNNPSMLAINAKLGFVQGSGVIVFEKYLD